ncbi:phosphoribosylanthranilate isomerase [Phaeodactylibacter luteus]|uniref:N-(5'-phosphoribosyl)anthranilate isomerase n=1 Tax=Phaeodactylibacter luteus TaxID=1564516 RepID=A0A5C6RIA4_9BACT|nr:N-(5'-phosphoribosyl)anthranilate isomerase [Phaeodactylibacter luteus]TXB62021.1 N-(5'-phosphoribosyl)anthranilate isomerase [Phaeodactylibacter luteus]
MLKTKIKASSITNLTDARYFAAWEAEWLGFNLDPGTENYVSPATVQAMKEWVDGVKIVGEFNQQEARDILTSVDILGLDAVQLGTFASLETLQALHAKEVPVLQELVVEEWSDLSALATQMEARSGLAAYFLLDFAKNGLSWAAAKSNVLAELRQLAEDFPLLLNLPFPASEVEEVLEQTGAAGFSVQGGEEEKVGFKSFDELDDLFEALEVFE